MINLPNDLLKGWDIVVIDDEEDSLMVAQIMLDEYGANSQQHTPGRSSSA